VSKLILAFDPGVTGAFAVLTESGGYVHVEDLPIIAMQSLKWVSGALTKRLQIVASGNEVTAIVERVHAMPKNGVIAAFSQGSTLCSILPQLQVLGMRIQLVPPQSWKRQLGLISKVKMSDIERKRAALDMARLLFPSAPLERQKDHGRAEALLIGTWYVKHQLRLQVAA
jgi:hypothetical protein